MTNLSPLASHRLKLVPTLLFLHFEVVELYQRPSWTQKSQKVLVELIPGGQRPYQASLRDLGIIKGVGVKGHGVILIWDLNMAKFQTVITRHHWPQKPKCVCQSFYFAKLSDLDILRKTIDLDNMYIIYTYIYIYII